MPPRLALTTLLLALVAAGCGEPAVTADTAVEADGGHRVGVRSFTLTDGARARTLPALAFYPAEPAPAPEAGLDIEQLEDAPRRTTYAGLLDAAPAGCPTRSLAASLAAPLAAGSYPLVLVSHCHECTRFSTASIAARLASHGFVVVAVDHVGNTLWNQLAGDGVALDEAFLAVRVADLRFALDQILAGGAEVPAGLAAAVAGQPVGVLGHSFGAVTAGLTTQEDSRVAAAFALAAPMENPLLPGVTVSSISRPLGFLVATEDNSITELGNTLIRNNFDAAGGPAFKVEVKDAGHWSVSDLLGVVPGFMPGCGQGTRQTDGQAFSYVAPATGRGLAMAYVTAFFKANLRHDEGAAAYLTAPRRDGQAEVASR